MRCFWPLTLMAYFPVVSHALGQSPTAHFLDNYDVNRPMLMEPARALASSLVILLIHFRQLVALREESICHLFASSTSIYMGLHKGQLVWLNHLVLKYFLSMHLPFAATIWNPTDSIKMIVALFWLEQSWSKTPLVELMIQMLRYGWILCDKYAYFYTPKKEGVFQI